MSRHEAELERIRTAYEVRDSPPEGRGASAPASPWSGAGYRFYMQRLEWDLLAALGRAGVSPAGARVLEVGCGSGYFLNRLTEYGAAQGAGIDLMEDRIAQARERYPRLELTAGDASELPWEDGSFDLVTHFTCLSSILDPGLRADIAGEMWRVTRPGGLVVSYDMRGTPWPLRALGALRAGRSTAAVPGTPTTPIELGELRRLWPGGELRARAVTLAPALWPLAERGRWLASLAAAVPVLRTHLLVTVRKPA
jgi:SAM-dependent methyltransferase